MKKQNLIALLTVPIWVVLAYYLVSGVYEKITLDNMIKESEKQVVKKLEIIRTLEKAFKDKYQYYTSNEDSLINFIKSDSVFILSRRDVRIERPEKDRWKGDSVYIKIDTIGVKPAREVVFDAADFAKIDFDNLMVIPGTDKKFSITSGKIVKNEIEVAVIEVVDKYPVDPNRNDENERRNRKFLRFGSMDEVTLTGNWE